MFKSLLICLIEIHLSFCQLKLSLPSDAVSFCSFRIGGSLDPQGCLVNFKPSSTGKVLLVHTVLELQFQITQLEDENAILVMPTEVFADKLSMKELQYNKKIAGIIVLEPKPCTSSNEHSCKFTYSLNSFSEISVCDDLYYKKFFKKFCMFENAYHDFNYYNTLFTFPIVLMKDKENFQAALIDCYENYNFYEGKSSKCYLTISGYYAPHVDLQFCINNRFSMFKDISLGQFKDLCSDISGYNIYFTVTDKPLSKTGEVVLILTKMDSLSIFDKAAHGVEDIYPSLTLAIKFLSLLLDNTSVVPDDKEFLFGFLDNETPYKLGSLRLIYDLKMNRVSDGIKNISDLNIILVISLNFGTMFHSNIYAFFNQCNKNPQVCNTIKYSFQNSQISLNTFIYDMDDPDDIWVRAVNAPKVEFRDEVLRKPQFQNSFLDKSSPSSYEKSILMINMLVSIINNIFPGNIIHITDFKLFDPSPLSACLYNITCPDFKELIGKQEMLFYLKYARPFVSQSFINRFADMKQVDYYDRLSHFITKLLIYLYFESNKTVNDCQDLLKSNEFIILVNDTPKCYVTRMQVVKDFNILNYMTEDYMDLSKQHLFNFTHYYRNVPLLYHQSAFTNAKIDIYVSMDRDLYTMLTVMATFTGAVTMVAAIFIHRNINSILPDEIF